MSPGFRRGGSHSTLGLVRETAKVGARIDTSGGPAEPVEPLLLHKIGPDRPTSAPRRTRPKAAVGEASPLWESGEALRATEGVSYWLPAFSAEAAGGDVTGLERNEIVSSEAWRVHP